MLGRSMYSNPAAEIMELMMNPRAEPFEFGGAGNLGASRVFSEMNQLLDKKLPLLKQMDVNENKSNDSLENYPIEWNEMLGRIFHKLLANYIDTNRILYTVPYPIVSDYR